METSAVGTERPLSSRLGKRLNCIDHYFDFQGSDYVPVALNCLGDFIPDHFHSYALLADLERLLDI